MTFVVYTVEGRVSLPMLRSMSKVTLIKSVSKLIEVSELKLYTSGTVVLIAVSVRVGAATFSGHVNTIEPCLAETVTDSSTSSLNL
jgi:hypothetical protein